MEPHRIRAYVLLLIVSAIWATAGPVIKFTLGGISPLPFLTYRFGLSALLALAIFAFSGIHLPKDRRTLIILLSYSFFNSTVTLGLLFFGLNNTTVLDMTLITLTVPLVMSVAGSYFLKEHITMREKVGMSIAFLGTIITVFEPLISSRGDGLRLSGNILILMYIVATIIPSLQAKILLRQDVSPSLMTNLSFVVGFATLLPFVLLKYGPAGFISTIAGISLPYHLGVFFMAFISGTIAYILANRAQKTIEVSEAALFSYLYPIFSAPLAIFWLGEKITSTFMAGAFVIILGVIIAEYKKRKTN